MAISYQPLLDYIEPKGMTVRSLFTTGIISNYAYKAILNDNPISLSHIDAICQHLDLPIEGVVKIIKD